MKKNKTKYNNDFFSHAKEVMGKERFDKSRKRGQKKAVELKLKMAREMFGLNQTDLKGLSQPEVSKIEKRKDLKISTLVKYANSMGLKVKICFFIEDDEDQQIEIFG